MIIYEVLNGFCGLKLLGWTRNLAEDLSWSLAHSDRLVMGLTYNGADCIKVVASERRLLSMYKVNDGLD